ncbi:MAG: peptidase M48 [Gammaproteobacteria bacterium RIFCSPLOWO2_02_FULL_61_13]|nr:MAG: peptidase M48 [Gammaproteobacteria bacterium RIFCSPLOWO2_02_FULL_61_13]
MNTALIIALAVGFCIQCALVRRHVAHIAAHRDTVPPAFAGHIPLAAHQKAADYTRAKVRLGLVDFAVSAGLVLLWTLGGMLDALDRFWRGTETSALWSGVAVVITYIVISALLELPLSLYRTFRLEQRFGFNRMTLRLFIVDLLKQGVLLLLIGVPLVTLVLWTMIENPAHWWFLLWVIWLAFSLIMMWAYPAFIAPWFNKFRPLADAALRARIEALLQRNGFASQGIFVMDGSSRSTHGNAYFTGMGTNKRIVFFDTLIGELSHEEIEAVLAHELGHFKCNHISSRITIMAAVIFAGCALLGWLAVQTWFYADLGVSAPSVHIALILFLLIAPAFTFFLQPGFSWLSRRHEFEADDFAAGQSQAAHLIHALVKLYRENANTLTPDPLYSSFHDSHPPAPVRIAHLQGSSA